MKKERSLEEIYKDLDDITKSLKPVKSADVGVIAKATSLIKSKPVAINMELRNGDFALFTVSTNKAGFKYKGGYYIFDDDLKYYNSTIKLWCYDFHQDFSMPIKRKLPINTIKKTLETGKITQVEYATNPTTLERFIISQIAEGIMKGQQISDFLSQIRLIIIITMIASIIHLLLFLQQSGILSRLHF